MYEPDFDDLEDLIRASTRGLNPRRNLEVLIRDMRIELGLLGLQGRPTAERERMVTLIESAELKLSELAK